MFFLMKDINLKYISGDKQMTQKQLRNILVLAMWSNTFIPCIILLTCVGIRSRCILPTTSHRAPDTHGHTQYKKITKLKHKTQRQKDENRKKRKWGRGKVSHEIGNIFTFVCHYHIVTSASKQELRS